MLFIVSAVVVLLGVVYNNRQAAAFEYVYSERLAPIIEADGSPLPPGLSPESVRGWLDRAADSAANFPATVLTLVAYAEFKWLEGPVGSVCLLLVGVIATVVMMSRIGPRYSSGALPYHLSVWTIGILAGNVVGFALICA